jgi:transcriptional regulator with XRE-family HTH domain
MPENPDIRSTEPDDHEPDYSHLTRAAQYKPRYRPRKPRARTLDLGYIVGERVRKRRKQCQMTQVQLAEKTFMPQGSIARIENGHVREVESKTLVALALALKVSTDWLLGLLPEEAVETTPKPQRPRKGQEDMPADVRPWGKPAPAEVGT